jgi:peptidoglycan biosynthesis protein MviN/MurJ (putative lipid II flippase)
VLSLAYNLFLPALVSVIYLLLVLGCFIPWIQILTETLTNFVLKVATHPPALYEYHWRVHDFPLGVAVVVVAGILVGSIYLKEKEKLNTSTS